MAGSDSDVGQEVLGAWVTGKVDTLEVRQVVRVTASVLVIVVLILNGSRVCGVAG